jgi:hypothetical protein
MNFYETVENSFPRFQIHTNSLVTNWVNVREQVPMLMQHLKRDNHTYADALRAIDVDYLTWCASKQGPAVSLVADVSKKIVRSTRYANPEYDWYVPLIDSLLNLYEDADKGLCNQYHMTGAYTRQSLPWALVFTTVPVDLVVAFSTLVDLTNDSRTSKSLEEDLIIFASRVDQIRKFKCKSLGDFQSQIDVLDEGLTRCFSGTEIGSHLYDKRRNSPIIKQAKALSIAMYKWLDSAKKGATLSFLDTDPRSSLERSFYEQAAKWVIENRVKTVKLPREPSWVEYVNSLIRVSNVVALHTSSGKTSGLYVSPLHHIVLANSKPTDEYQKWLSLTSPIYRMLAFS